ncbi:uncharacterized protein [Typha latifolia]|uniref:uncharacterized protein n=1 Tax=Typha latifolia TaxID=4733 RepID=UPI003C2E4267
MYGGYTAAALALRAKSSISYDCVPSSSSSSGYSAEFALNPRLLLYNGYLLRQSSLLYWSPSRTVLAGSRRLWPRWTAKESWGWRRCPSLSVEIRCCCCDRVGCERSCLEADFGEFGQSRSNLEKDRRVCDCDRFRCERSKLEADRGEFDRSRSNVEENRRVLRRGERDRDAWRSGSCSACGSEWSPASREGRGRVVRREIREIWEYDDEKDAEFRVSDRKGREQYDYEDDYNAVRRKDGRERFKNSVNAKKKKTVDRRAVWRGEDSEEEAEFLIDSAREDREESAYEEKNVVDRRYSEEDSWRPRKTSGRTVDWEEGLSSQVKLHSSDDRLEAERRFDLARAERNDFAHEEERLGRRESREGSRKDRRTSQVHEDDKKWVSSSNSKADARKVDKRVNLTSSDQGLVVRTEEKKSTQKIKEISEVHDANVGRASHFERLYEEMKAKNREDTSTSVQNFAEMRRAKRSVTDQQVIDEKEVNISKSKIDEKDINLSKIKIDEREVNLYKSKIDEKEVNRSKSRIDVTKVDTQVNSGSALKQHQTESRRSSQNLTEISLAKNSNIDGVSNSWSHYDETRAKDRESSSTSVQNSFQMRRDKDSQLNQQVVDNSQLSMQNVTRTDVSNSNKSDTVIAISSQNIHDTRIDNRVYSTTVVNIGHEQMGQQEYLRKDAENNSQVSGFARSNTERWDNSQEERNRRIEDERVKRQYSLRGESERDTNASHYVRSDAERMSDYKEMSGSRRENGKRSFSIMVEEQEANEETHQQLKAKMTFAGNLGSSSSSKQTDEFDNQAERDEMNLVRNDALESATRLEKSSASYVGEFVDKLQQEISTSGEKDYSSECHSETQIGVLHRRTSQAATAAQSSTLDATTKHKDEKYIEEGAMRSSSRSGMKGPSDEMWDVKGPTSQETFRFAEREEVSSPAGAAEVALTGTETAHAQRSSKSLWNYVADIVKLGWISRAESRNSTKKSGKRSSSNDSIGSEGWFSGQEQDEDDEMDRKGDTSTAQEPILIKRPIDQSYPNTPAGPSQGSSVVPRMGAKVTISDASTTASVDFINEGFSAPSSSTILKPEHVAWIENENSRKSNISSVATIDQSSIVKDDNSSPTIAEISGSANVQIPVGSYVKQTENSVIEEPPAMVRIEGTDAELKRRKFQRNKQVLKESFDEWEEAYKRESQQRKLDEFFMREALVEAQRAADTWEVPVGAVLVRNGEIIARGCNLVEELRDSTAHAEMICIREASNHLRTWRLAGTTLYVTLEPCAMCAGAILQARIDTVVWGAPNKLLGADGSWVRLFPGDGENSNADLSSQTAGPVHPFHPKITIKRGVLATECSEIMQQFFQLRRKKNKKTEPPPSCLPVASHPIKFFTKMHGLFSVFCL